MWETIKNDPILKTVAIIILSVLGFGFAFNIMFGQKNNGMEGEMMDMGGGYSLENTLSYILTIGVKLLLIALIIAALIVVFRFITRGVNPGGENKMFENIKNDPGSMASSEAKRNDQPILKAVTIVAISIIALGFILMLFSGILGNGGMYGMNGNTMMGYPTSGIGLTAILAFLLKLLLFISVVGVIVGVFMFIKQNYSKQVTKTIGTFNTNDTLSIDCPKCGAKVSEGFKFCHSCGEKLKPECASCGAEFKPEWKCCPDCGAEKA
jgi:hypothetical protein